MSAKSSISNFITWAKCCSSDIAHCYVMEATYGDPESEQTLDKLKLLDCLIGIVERFNIATDDDFIEGGVLFLGGKQIVLSKNNSLSLESADTKISISSDDINCISEDQVCSIINKIKGLCPNC